MTGIHRCAGAALLVAALLPVTVLADEESEARDLFERGQEHYRAGEYRLASDYFMRAHVVFPSPEFVFNAAQAHRLGQDCQRSADLYRQFLADVPDHSERDLIRRHLLDMEQCAERQRVALERAEAGTLSPEARSPSHASKSGNTVAWVLTGVGAGLVTGSALFAVDSYRASGDVERIFEDGATWTPAADAIAQRGEISERLAWVTGGLGMACLATGTYLLLRDSHEGEGLSSEPRVSSTKGGAIAGWAWRY